MRHSTVRSLSFVALVLALGTAMCWGTHDRFRERPGGGIGDRSDRRHQSVIHADQRPRGAVAVLSRRSVQVRELEA